MIRTHLDSDFLAWEHLFSEIICERILSEVVFFDRVNHACYDVIRCGGVVLAVMIGFFALCNYNPFGTC